MNDARAPSDWTGGGASVNSATADAAVGVRLHRADLIPAKTEPDAMGDGIRIAGVVAGRLRRGVTTGSGLKRGVPLRKSP